MAFEPGREKTGGRVAGVSKNKDYQEILDLAAKLNVEPMKIKLLLAAGRYKELGYSEAEIEELSVRDRIETQGKNAGDVLPYFHGKRAAVNSNGDDSESPLMAILAAMNDRS